MFLGQRLTIVNCNNGWEKRSNVDCYGVLFTSCLVLDITRGQTNITQDFSRAMQLRVFLCDLKRRIIRVLISPPGVSVLTCVYQQSTYRYILVKKLYRERQICYKPKTLSSFSRHGCFLKAQCLASSLIDWLQLASNDSLFDNRAVKYVTFKLLKEKN